MVAHEDLLDLLGDNDDHDSGLRGVVDVFADVIDLVQTPGIRAGIKEFSDWPTVPQLYVKGEFVGGSDIMMEMFESGELQELLSEAA